MNFSNTPFEVKNPDGLTIRGFEIKVQDNKGSGNAVILSHGFRANMSYTRPYAEFLVQNGFTCFIFDFCGTWNGTSDGTFRDYMTPITEVGDLKAVREMVEARKEFKTISLFGQSQGGFVSSLSAAWRPENVASLMLLFPAMCIPDNAREGAMQNYKFDPNNIPAHIGTPPMELSGEYARSVLHMDIFKEITGYHGPVLLEHGTADPIVSLSYAVETDQTYKENGNYIQYYEYQGAGHGFKGSFVPESEEDMLKFLKAIHLAS